ncbi:uncharacterized protein CANTADRAFT_177540 [Suhomyces tanzawaensis NRRL Y-17324]|uniref:C2H2-type domain-containing protein n=1 Tax=Suhomyces tanzawaensis NRRL Y-17324 TaxID=984487 RepID=A0A1E4SMW8_9ASCO|nr:uncharacterized protein CANTADRAFT_177540 [Suhomyces tanzawaensis NRRL Y-17324]ODV80874.1 hypothetical protein CANTADRAFT_177540 [Suhomyces tanzawaensis NRRL Y-17324]
MTSVVLPSLKRSITDIMDEELYQLPNSPIQVNSFQHSHLPSQQLASQPQRSDSPKLGFNGSPAASHAQLYSHPNTSNSSSLSNFLNIPDSFLDYKHNPAPNTSAPVYDSNAMDVDMQYSQPRINPFTDYANPDSLNTTPPQDSQLYYPPLPQQFPTKPDRRRRITFLDEDQANNKKDDDYLLYNPDIQPSQLINNKFWNDDLSPLFVPPNQFNQAGNPNDYSQQFLNANNNIIPGYENDYLSMDAFDEDVEEELSDDDEDDSKYFHVDDEFDQLVMNHNGENYNETDVNMNFMDLDDYLKPATNTVNMSNIEQQGLNANDIKHEDFFNIKQEELKAPNAIISSNTQQESLNMEDDQQFLSDEDEDEEEKSLNTRVSLPHMSAAEISANNPTHACDLINPSTGVPCHKQFSRPYDLIRHQETIHASKKKIFRCVICEGRMNGGAGNGKLKTFSRGDALSRHIKVKHGLVGKEALDLINEAKDNVEYVSV